MRKNERLNFADLLLLSLWFGLAYGLLEAFVLLVVYNFTHFLMWENGVSPPILWVAPVVDTALFLLGGVLLWLLSWILGPSREHLSRALSLTFFVGAATLGLLGTTMALQPWGCVAVAAGVMVQMFRWARKEFTQNSYGFFRRTLAPLLVIAVVAGVIGQLWPGWRTRRFLASLPPALPGQPNVLFIVLDTCRAQQMSAYGYPRTTTPNIARIGSEGMVFDLAFSAATSSPPGHLALMSGKDPGDWFSGVVHGRFQPLLSETLANRGYATVACIANSWVMPQLGLGRGFARFEVYFPNFADRIFRTFYGKVLIHYIRWWGGYYDQPGRKRGPEVNRELLQWIDQTLPTQRPFFALLNYMDIHEPRIVPEPYTNQFSPLISRRNLLAVYGWRCFILPFGCTYKKDLTPRDRQLLVDAYDTALAYEDYWIGQLYKELGRRGVLDNTLIVISADHGEALGEDDIWGHTSVNMREEVIHVPLILRYPSRVPAGVRVPYPVTTLRIPATAADIVGLGAGSRVYGTSLLENWQQPGPPVLTEAEGNYSLVSSKWHLVLRRDGKYMLYDLHNDPYEFRDLAGRTETALIETQLRHELALLAAQP